MRPATPAPNTPGRNSPRKTGARLWHGSEHSTRLGNEVPRYEQSCDRHRRSEPSASTRALLGWTSRRWQFRAAFVQARATLARLGWTSRRWQFRHTFMQARGTLDAERVATFGPEGTPDRSSRRESIKRWQFSNAPRRAREGLARLGWTSRRWQFRNAFMQARDPLAAAADGLAPPPG
jgi:hypothetical protein